MLLFQSSGFSLKKTTDFDIRYVTPTDTIALADGTNVVGKFFKAESKNVGPITATIGSLKVNATEVRSMRNPADPWNPKNYADTTGKGSWVPIDSATVDSRAGKVPILPPPKDTVEFVKRNGGQKVFFIGPVVHLDSSWTGPLKVITQNGDSMLVKEVKIAKDKTDSEPTGFFIWAWVSGSWLLVNDVVGQKPANITSVKDEKKIPASFELKGPYPNPFNPTATVSISLKKPTHVQLEVYDCSGKKVAEVFEGKLSSGEHELKVNLAGMSSGVYFFSLKTPEASLTAKALLVK